MLQIAKEVRHVEAVIEIFSTDGSLPNKTVAGLREDIDSDKLDLLRDFSVAARKEFLRLQY